VSGFAKITRDITERHEAHRLKATQEQLAASQKMDAIGQLSGGIAHDFGHRYLWNEPAHSRVDPYRNSLLCA
jgi:hypothetical protein